MEYRYSQLIDPRNYGNHGLCDGISLRVHHNVDIEEHGVIRLRNDWHRYVGSMPSVSLGGSMGPIYNSTSATIPECHPDRLEIVSYIMELGFLHDDLVDTSTVAEGRALDDQLITSLNEKLKETEKTSEKPGVERIQEKAIAEAMAIDPLRAKEMVAYWTMGLGVGRDRTQFSDFEDYLEYRIVDCGSFFMIALATFGMCLAIPSREKEDCFRLTRPAWAAAALTNDLQSWDKECKLIQTQDKVDMANGIWVVMKQYSINVDEAKSLVVQKVRHYVVELVDIINNLHTRKNLSLDSRRLIEATQYMVSGNVLWGMSTPRYHADRSLTDLQIVRMLRG
ncbi:fusicoccadiene synthase [Xylaria arbuscula]|nr:fusicoccadiene synthase [Xylaria arbuscula]